MPNWSIIVHQVEHFILVKVFFLNSKILDAVFFSFLFKRPLKKLLKKPKNKN